MQQIQQWIQQLEQPETRETVAKLDLEECTGCGSCVDACPEEAIELQDDVAVIDQAACTGCGSCVDACPNEAIELV
jgi:ferredoxin